MTLSGRIFRTQNLGPIFLILGMSPGCLAPTVKTPSTQASATSFATTGSTAAANLPRAVKIIFNSTARGSFSPASVAAASGGTTQGQVNAQGIRLGLQPTTVYNPDGSVLGTRTYNSDGSVANNNGWPAWLDWFDVGITSNGCAQFAGNSESTATDNCQVGSSLTPAGCGAPVGQFRVSEADCLLSSNPVASGTGGGSDPVYLRARFVRGASGLGLGENIMALVEYVSSSLNPAPQNPRACIQNGVFKPEACSDYAWKVFLKHSYDENSVNPSTQVANITIQPHFLLIPPTINSTRGSALSGFSSLGVNPTTRQIILPLAADSALNIFQLSRIQQTSVNRLSDFCAPNGVAASGANTPLCDGVIFYSITFFRI